MLIPITSLKLSLTVHRSRSSLLLFSILCLTVSHFIKRRLPDSPKHNIWGKLFTELEVCHLSLVEVVGTSWRPSCSIVDSEEEEMDSLQTNDSDNKHEGWMYSTWKTSIPSFFLCSSIPFTTTHNPFLITPYHIFTFVTVASAASVAFDQVAADEIDVNGLIGLIHRTSSLIISFGMMMLIALCLTSFSILESLLSHQAVPQWEELSQSISLVLLTHTYCFIVKTKIHYTSFHYIRLALFLSRETMWLTMWSRCMRLNIFTVLR